jgi:glycosyltransferase involved in cell wall biosynthesis
LKPQITVLVPLYNEEESLPELTAWISKVMQENGYSFEILFVDDGSRDDSWKVITQLKSEYPQVRGIKFLRNYGKAAGLNVGFENARGEVVITMDADLQDSPDEIPELYRMITEEGFDLVSGWKKKRYDPITKTVPTKLYNWATRKMSGIELHDFNCGLKAYRHDVVKNVEVYGDMHRYIPVLAKREGFSRIGEKVVSHQARKYGRTKFGMERFINGFLDLLTVSFVSRFGKKPMHLFGTFGTVMFLIGFILFAWIGGNKLYSLFIEVPAKNIAELSSFYIALTAMIIGTQLFLAGFLAEMVARSAPNRNNYKVSQILD